MDGVDLAKFKLETGQYTDPLTNETVLVVDEFWTSFYVLKANLSPNFTFENKDFI